MMEQGRHRPTLLSRISFGPWINLIESALSLNVLLIKLKGRYEQKDKTALLHRFQSDRAVQLVKM